MTQQKSQKKFKPKPTCVDGTYAHHSVITCNNNVVTYNCSKCKKIWEEPQTNFAIDYSILSILGEDGFKYTKQVKIKSEEDDEY